MNLQTRNWLLLIAAGSLLVVSVLIGGVLSVVGFQAANLANDGADGERPASLRAFPLLHRPRFGRHPRPRARGGWRRLQAHRSRGSNAHALNGR